MIHVSIPGFLKNLLKRKGKGTEVSRSQHSLFDVFAGVFKDGRVEQFNPDVLLRAKGMKILDEMLDNDADIKNSFLVKLHTRIALGWTFEPSDSEDEEALELKNFIEYCFEHMQHSTASWLLKMWDGLRQGFKLCEKVYGVLDHGPWKGKIGIAKLPVRNSRWYRFETDLHGSIMPNGIWEFEPSTIIGDPDVYIWQVPEGSFKRLAKNKFLHFVWGRRDDNGESLYGKSDFRAAYKYYWSNNLLMRLENAWLETYSRPFRWGTYGPGYSGPQQDALLLALETLEERRAAIFPEGGKVEVGETVASGRTSPFDAAMRRNSGSIRRAMLMGDLVQGEGDRKGSFALGKKHFDVFLLALEYLGIDTAEMVNRHLIRELIVINFGEAAVEKAPRMQFPSMNAGDTKTRAEVLDILIKATIVDPREDWVREYLDIPISDLDPEEPPVEPPPGTDPTPAPGAPPPAPKKAPSKPPTKPGGDGKGDPEKEPAGATKAFSVHALHLRRGLYPVEHKIDFAEVVLNLDDIAADARAEAAEGLGRTFDALKTSVRRRKIVERKDRIAATRLAPDMTGFKRAVRNMLGRAYIQGQLDGQREIDKGIRFLGGRPEHLSQKLYIDARDLAAKAGFDLEATQAEAARKLKITQEELNAYADRIVAETEAQARGLAERIREGTSGVVRAGIESGWSLKETLAKIDTDVKQKYLNELDQLGQRTGPLSDTLVNSAYNEGRMSLYEKTPLVEALVYSAVIDGVTTPFCQRHDGFQAAKDDPVWSSILPPNHFQCRSIIGSILRGEQWEPTAPPEASVRPAQGFDRRGFPTRAS